MLSRRRRTEIRLFHDQLESRLFLSVVAFESHVISTQADGAASVYAADVDGDGDVDVLSASIRDDKIAWYENTDGAGTFGPQNVITIQADRANYVSAADVDGDGDLDVLLALRNDGYTIAWYENTDGVGAFGPQQVIATQADGVLSVYATDVDGDGDVDVLSAAYRYGTIAWYENTDGAGTFGPQNVITTEADSATSIYAADVNGDGDVDVLSASFYDGTIAWYENTDGVGTFGPQRVISTLTFSATSVYAADLDGDGDLDVLSASLDDDKIAWHENTDGAGTFGPQNVITTQADSANSVYAADLDGDGDLDVLSASIRDDKIAWYENTDGAGTFGPQNVITTQADGGVFFGPSSVYAADVDGDGDADVLSASSGDDKIAWYENRHVGDSNDDGVFNSSDLAAVLAAGKYEDGLPNNATYDEGDWNQDGDFDSGDFVFALAAGNYSSGVDAVANDLAAAIEVVIAEEDKERHAFVA